MLKKRLPLIIAADLAITAAGVYFILNDMLYAGIVCFVCGAALVAMLILLARVDGKKNDKDSGPSK